MRKVYPFITIFICSVLSACASNSSSNSLNEADNSMHNLIAGEKMEVATPCAPTNPLSVKIYTQNASPAHPYRKIGKVTVSKYNFVGIRRQAATVHDKLRDLAASAGGTGLVDIMQDGRLITATIILDQGPVSELPNTVMVTTTHSHIQTIISQGKVVEPKNSNTVSAQPKSTIKNAATTQQVQQTHSNSNT